MDLSLFASLDAPGLDLLGHWLGGPWLGEGAHALAGMVRDMAGGLGGLIAEATGHGALLAQADDPVEARRVVTEKIGTDAPVDFSLWSTILRADPVVKAVIVILVIASIWSWAIIFDKVSLMRRMNRRADAFEDRFWSGGSVEALYEEVSRRPNSPIAAVFVAAMEEWQRSGSELGAVKERMGVTQRIERVMNVAIGREMSRLERRIGFLASVGATAPFIGLFGTVWGIMNAFREIAIQKDTSLATVAPGISEALFVTALGLAAAIPAVIAYNKLSNDMDRHAHRLENFSSEFGAIVSRQVESGAA